MSAAETSGHTPVLLHEVMDLLFAPGEIAGVVLDATFGRGGHARAMLERMTPEAQLIVADRDPEAVQAARLLAAEDPRLTVLHTPFSGLRQALASLGNPALVAVLMDLGVSSPQLDDGSRGFSFRQDAELDMRMDPGTGESAASWLNRATEDELVTVLREFGEARFARRIAAAIIAARPLHRTLALAEAVAGAIPRRFVTPGQHPATQTFMAIRMQVNAEIPEVAAGLDATFDALAVGGRLGVISFHSVETRVVKRFFQRHCRGTDLPRRLPVRSAESGRRARLVAGPVRPDSAETGRNPRARSAILRVLEKTT